MKGVMQIMYCYAMDVLFAIQSRHRLLWLFLTTRSGTKDIHFFEMFQKRELLIAAYLS